MATHVQHWEEEPVTTEVGGDIESPEFTQVPEFWRASSAGRAAGLFFLLLAAGAVALALLSWAAPETLPLSTRALLPHPVYVVDRLAMITPGYVLTAELAAYDDELFAFLMFDYLRHSSELGKSRLLLFFDPKAESRPYRLVLRGRTDLRCAMADAAAMQHKVRDSAGHVALTPALRVRAIEQQTRLFLAAYNLPVRRKLEEVPRAAISSYVRRFIRFKSTTDPRVRKRIEPVPQPLSADDAQRLAGDIITIAHFYSVPLEFFLGIGAMENNYMNVRGDLKHSIWKRRPAPDDVVLERRRGRVRVLNDSAGVWQITRETLRYAHTLVQKDTRDYTILPEHLRPPDKLNVAEVDPHVLTTYAGRLLRDLLDQFNGDVTLAVSAYNGGPARPNLRYGEGVHRAAAHARRVLEQAAALNGESVARMTWLRSP